MHFHAVHAALRGTSGLTSEAELPDLLKPVCLFAEQSCSADRPWEEAKNELEFLSASEEESA